MHGNIFIYFGFLARKFKLAWVRVNYGVGEEHSSLCLRERPGW